MSTRRHQPSEGITRTDTAAEDGGYDFAVVGTGPGGATVARELARGGHSVLILERGRAAPVTGSGRQTARELMFPGRGLHLSGSVALFRGDTVGGSSIYFFGSAWEPPYEQLDRYGLDLREAVEEVKDELRPAVVPHEAMGPRAQRVAESASALGHDWRPIAKFLDPERLAGPPMGSYAAPSYEAKWNARKFVDDAVDAGATLVTGAKVERVSIEQGVARGVEFVHRRRRVKVRAERVVLAAGGFGSPLILRASGIERAGRDYFYDPVITVNGEVDDLDAGAELPMLQGEFLEDEGFMLTDINVPVWWFRLDALLAGRPDWLRSYRQSLSIMVKAKDDLSGAITGRGGPGKPLTDGDKAKLTAGCERARQILERAGARRTYRTGASAVHPGATAKVGDVVDADLQTEIEGLYVCDASVIPTAWGRPPSLTVLALARRLARHLTDRPLARVGAESTVTHAEPAARR